MILIGRRDDSVTAGITTAVVMVAAALSPHQAWHEPILRLIDTVVGIGVGVSCKWAGSYVFHRMAGEPVRWRPYAIGPNGSNNRQRTLPTALFAGRARGGRGRPQPKSFVDAARQI